MNAAADPLADPARLTPWMAAHVAGFAGPLEARRLSGGQSNPTFMLRTPGRDYVLRRKPAGTLLKSAHAVDREFRVQQALAATSVPVAPVRALCADESVIGAMFYVMDRVEGRIFDDPRLPGLAPETRAAIYDAMNAALAALHQVDVGAAGLADYGRSGGYFARQLDRWTRQYRAAEIDPIPAMDALIAALEADPPPDQDGAAALVHGDWRIDNLIFHPSRAEVAAVLDWELSTLGHPFADLAYQLMQWRMPPGPEGRGLAGEDRAALGLPSDAEYIAAYCARRAIAPPDGLHREIAFSFFRMASILQGVFKRALDGNAADPERGRRMGALAPVFAEKGLEALRMG